ncbi:MAG TPA: hypothetical protein VN538_01370 [Clostridia bacterium]|nr:hypothetical protein [Clostridia bacterium]
MNKAKLSRPMIAFVLLFALVAMAAVTQLDLSTQVKGVLPLANGGTGLGSAGNGTAPVSNGTIFSAVDIATQSELDTHAGLVAAHNFLGDFTVATRPSAAASSGKWVVITDALTGGNCGSGGGSAIALCRSNGSAWVALGDGSGSATINFADAETPSGTVNGTNAAFTLTNSPSPTSSLRLYKNGQLMIEGAGADYTITGNTVTYTASAKPLTGDVHRAYYRY